MPRHKSPIRTIFKTIALPEDIVSRMELELFCPIEGRIPVGAQQKLIVGLLRGHFAQQDAMRAAVKVPT